MYPRHDKLQYDIQDSNLGLVSKNVKLIPFSDISTFYITHILSGHWAADLEMTNQTAFPIFQQKSQAMSKEIRSIQKLIKPRAPKSSRVTSTKLMEKNEANDERKSKVLFKTTKGHDQLKSSRIPMEGENFVPNASHEGFLLEKEQPSTQFIYKAYLIFKHKP